MASPKTTPTATPEDPPPDDAPSPQSLDELMRHLARHHADEVLLSYPTPEGAYDVNLTGAQLEHVTAHTAIHYARIFAQFPAGEVTGRLDFGGGDSRIVAMISVSTLSSYLTAIALQRLGYRPMFLSPRLAMPGYAHLLRTTGCEAVVALGPSLDLMRTMQQTYDDPLEVVEMLDDASVLAMLTKPPVDLPMPDPARTGGHVVHTGGTTGLPKPVALATRQYSNRWVRQRVWRPTPDEDDEDRVKGPLRVLGTVPHFHVFGIATFIQSLRQGAHLSLLSPYRPVTASIVWRAMDAMDTEVLNTVPYVLKFFADMEGGVERLAKLRDVRAGGSATPDDLGDLLIRKGVKVWSVYGLTEVGAAMRQVGPGLGEWNYLTPLPADEASLMFEKVGDDLYHLVILPDHKTLRMSDRPDGSYGTKDLFRPHPDNLPGNDTRPGIAKWKFVARQGDIIVLVNGENADPTPIEMAVMLDPHIQMAVAFGNGHERLGLLVIPSDKAAGMSKEEVIQTITPALEKGNQQASDYAKISPDDIIVKPVGTPFPFTAKMTLQRPILNKLFAKDIEAHYAARDADDTENVKSDEDVRDAVRRAVALEVKEKNTGHTGHAEMARQSNGEKPAFADDTDFFAMGMDSLQSSLVRRRLERQISLPHGTKLATNVVFEYPTVDLLSDHILKLRLGKTDLQNGKALDAEALAREMARKYTDLVLAADRRDSAIDIAGEDETSDSDQGHVVVLTGATGYIGVQLLKTLLKRADVSRVYALIRTQSARDHEAATRRVMEALERTRVKDDIQPADGISKKLQCLSANLAVADLGLSAAEYGEIKASVTAVVHNAWAVNFNMSLASFEPNVASVAHLLNLARSTYRDRTFVFISSVAALGGMGRRAGRGRAEERMYDWAEASPGHGYGQSKWVAEQVCAAASATGPGSVRILRVGQVSGDTKHGIWNPAEAVPAMVQSALTIGALPRMEDKRRNTLCWLPSDVAAAAITDLTMLKTSEKLAVYHVASPQRLKWNEDVLPALEKAGLQFRIVPQVEWVRMLEAGEKDVEKNPPYRLIEHFKLAYGRAGDAQERLDEDAGVGGLDLTLSLQSSPSLKKAPVVDSELVTRYAQFWLGHWAQK